MAEFVAVNGFTYQISNPLVVATVVLTGVPSVKNKAGGQGICKDGFGITVTAITVPSVGAVTPDPGPYNVTISATALKVKADNTLVLRVGDKTGTINATPYIPGTPPTPSPISFTIDIINAGQTKVKAA